LKRLADLYESKKKLPQVARQKFDLWATNAHKKMEFKRISKYLQEIDISLMEKKELEQKVHSVNEDNENIQR